LLIQKVTDDMTNGLRLDQDSIGAVEQATLLEFEVSMSKRRRRMSSRASASMCIGSSPFTRAAL
jgi:hypothetical protein